MLLQLWLLLPRVTSRLRLRLQSMMRPGKIALEDVLLVVTRRLLAIVPRAAAVAAVAQELRLVAGGGHHRGVIQRVLESDEGGLVQGASYVVVCCRRLEILDLIKRLTRGWIDHFGVVALVTSIRVFGSIV